MSVSRDLSKRYRVDNGRKFRLKDFDPGDSSGVKSKRVAEKELPRGVEQLSDLQDKLYAQDRWAILLIFQAMDAAGKDGAIKHVMSGVNPQGCQVFSFKQPSVEELDHDYMWRANKCIPERGRIGIFNRSYYEEVLIVRVHKEMLERERMPPSLVTKNIWNERFADINAYEHYLSRNGIVIRKFFLNLSKEEQKKRFLKRLDEPAKNWKFSASDVAEREHWPDYMTAYEEMIQHTATPHAPWYVVPADNKWYTRLVVAAAIVDALEDLNLHYPIVDRAKRKELKAARVALEHEGRHH
ncbi:MAG: polyphosphate kinase 2 family protein [Candidatus Binatus sp.]|uniref:polyphosphate kinase 2 family protein n=1 Tax=Candidatus Binatus sp. TaxID=2811406 RepID=UPI003C78B229